MPPHADRRHLLVVAAVIEENGRILMAQRRADQPLPLLWEFPGGKIEPGESPPAALRREIREELGCDVRVGAIMDVVFHTYAAFDLYLLIYRCTVVGAPPQALTVAALAWVDRAEVPALPLPPADVEFAARLARGG